MANVVLRIDGEDFSSDVNLVSLKRSAHFFDKFAKRDIRGVLHRELIGVYINYTLEICIDSSLNAYHNLWKTLTRKQEKHNVVVSSNTHTDDNITYNAYQFEAYFADIKDEAIWLRADNNKFRKLTVEFIATKPHEDSNYRAN